jgi:deoxyribodipyrimidine photo-lyase
VNWNRISSSNPTETVTAAVNMASGQQKLDKPVIVWFRQDLRLADNPALSHAAADGKTLIPLFVLDDETPVPWQPGGASRWWLHGSLKTLAEDLAARGAPLLLLRGRADSVIPRLIQTTGAGAIVWNRCYEPSAIARDRALKAILQADGVSVRSFPGNVLNEPWAVLTGAGEPYRVFTPFWRAVLSRSAPDRPLPAPERLNGHQPVPAGESLESWTLRPSRPDWAGGLRASWQPGEKAARGALSAFLTSAAADYPGHRDFPAVPGTSRLSPALHFGEISPRQIWTAAVEAKAAATGSAAGIDTFLRQIGWREFCHGLLYHFPTLPERPLNPAFENFPWADDETLLRAWQRGQTGFPIVDAGMRQLWQTGWMHNRVRMIAGSFLVKHLLQPWQAGQAWFWDTLVDADLANNAAGWQWIAGCGADAAPYFRIFNPILQAGRFDAAGHYVRQFVPELARLSDEFLHTPWLAPDHILQAAGVTLGRSYPRPIVLHEQGRARALAAWTRIRGEGA